METEPQTLPTSIGIPDEPHAVDGESDVDTYEPDMDEDGNVNELDFD